MKKIISILSILAISALASQPSKNENEIKYNKELTSYSLYKTDKAGYEEYVKKRKISKIMLKEAYGKKDNPKGVVLSALAYDYGYKRPDLAEPFYSLFDANSKEISFDDKLRYMDYLLRTGRISEIENKMTRQECIENFKSSGKCFYYLGLVKYLKTGDNRNSFLNISKSNVEKAKEIYFQKFNDQEVK